MSGDLRDPHLPPYADDAEMRRLLASEQDAPAPSTDIQVRIARRMTASLAESAPRWTSAGKLVAVGAVTAAVAVTVGLAYWGWAAHHATPVAVPVLASAAEPPSNRPSNLSVTPPALVAQHAVAPGAGVVPPAESADFPLVRVRRADTLAAEQKLVEAAREALAHGEPRLAYESLDAHAHKFPRGQLREERESLSIRALLTQGRPAQARQRAEAFLAHEGESLFAPVVRSMLVKARTAAPDDTEREP